MHNKELYPVKDTHTIIPILHRISVFGGLNNVQLTNVFNQLEKVYFKKGEMIFELGDMPKYLYIIKQGKVKLVLGKDNEYLELVELGVGKCFGETAFISLEPHTASAVATEDCELIVLSTKTLMSFLKLDRDLFSLIVLNIAREAARRLNNTENILLHYFLKEKNNMTTK